MGRVKRQSAQQVDNSLQVEQLTFYTLALICPNNGVATAGHLLHPIARHTVSYKGVSDLFSSDLTPSLPNSAISYPYFQPSHTRCYINIAIEVAAAYQTSSVRVYIGSSMKQGDRTKARVTSRPYGNTCREDYTDQPHQAPRIYGAVTRSVNLPCHC